MSVRKVKFEYYQIVCRKTGDLPSERDRLFDLAQWMDKASKKSLEGRTYNYRTEQVRLDTAYYDDELNYYFLHFVRLRDTNIPSKVSLAKQVEPFELEDDEYLGEEVSALYDDINNILMLQRNKYSLGPEGIEDYLNLLWDKEDEQISLRIVCSPNAFELARKSGEYRKINLRFADLNLEEKKGKLDNLISPIKKVVGSFSEYEGINAQVTITVGNKKGLSLSPKTIEDTIIDIQENRELFANAEIVRREDDESRVEVIDLFEHKAHDYASFRMEKRETLSHYTIAKAMWERYSDTEGCDNRKKDILSYLRE